MLGHILRALLLAAALWLPSGSQAQTPVAPRTFDWTPGTNFLDWTTGPTALTTTSTALTVATNGAGTVGLQATGSGAGLTFAAEGTVDGSNWFTLPMTVPSTCATVTSASANGNWVVPAAGYSLVRVNLSAISGGTETFTLRAGQGAFDACTTISSATVSIASSSVTNTAAGSAVSTLVLKASAGSLIAAYATNLTATAGFLAIVNATSAPGDGAITPLDCVPLPANGVASINYAPGPYAAYSTGITAVVTSATTCFTKTTGTITAFIKGAAQ